MTPDEVADIFAEATAAHETITSKPNYADTDKFDEKVNYMLVELIREHDGDEFGILCLRQDVSCYSTITGGSTLTKIGSIASYDRSIDKDANSSERIRAEVTWKVKINDSKVEASAESAAKKIMLATFDDAYANRLKHHIKLCSGITYFQLIQHLIKHYRKLYQLNML